MEEDLILDRLEKFFVIVFRYILGKLIIVWEVVVVKELLKIEKCRKFKSSKNVRYVLKILVKEFIGG